VPELFRRGCAVPPTPEVSVVILVQERLELLLRCLDSLSRLEAASVAEVVVVANGTPPAGLAVLLDRPDLVTVISPVNLGFAAGCNWGARFTRGRHIVLLNDDTEVEPGWLGSLVGVAESDARIGAVGSRLLNPDGTLQEAGSILWRDGGTHQVRGESAFQVAAGDRLRDVDYCSACGLLVTRPAWDAVGGFDEAYFPAYHEDVDLCLTLRAHGYRTVYAPEARIRHHRGAGMNAQFRAFAAARNGRLFVAKWASALPGYEPQPDPAQREAAVEAAIRRAEARPASPPGPEQPPPPKLDPSELESLRAQVRALEAARALSDDYIAWLQSGGARPRRRLAFRRHLRRLVLRLPGGRRAAAWVSGRPTGARR
jgi:GT2 family glycosyltransferase